MTLGGYIPLQTLEEDLISTAAFGVQWLHASRNTQFSFTADGTYIGRIKYSELSSPGGSVSLGAAHKMGRLQLKTSGTAALVNADQFLISPTSTQQLITSQTSFDDLSRTTSYPHSRIPNPTAAAWFIPISPSDIVLAEGYGNQLSTSSVNAGLSYSKSARLSVFFDSGYSSVLGVGRTNEPSAVLLEPSNAALASGGVNWALGRRSEITGSVSYAKSIGAFNSESSEANVAYGWTGRQWFGRVTTGIARRSESIVAIDTEGLRPGTEGLSPLQIRKRFEPTYRVTFGYKTITQAFLVSHMRAPNDSQGYGSLTGMVIGTEAGWYWTPRLSKWSAYANLDVQRVPGNYFFIFTWIGNAGLTRHLTPTTEVGLSFLFDRHGSKGFEGFHLGRQALSFNVGWKPNKRFF